MTGYLIRRLIQAIIVTLIVTIIAFLLLHLVPGGEAHAVLGQRASAAEIAAYNKLYGFNQPFYVQYVKWVGQILHGNLGFSTQAERAGDHVLIGQDLPKTVVLALLGTGVGLAVRHPARRSTRRCAATALPTTC